MDNHFLHKPSEYSRDLNVVSHYVRDSSLYLHKQTGRSLEECRAFVESKVKNGAIHNPPTLIMERNKYGDREKKVIPLLDYIKDVEVNDRILSPTLVAYYNPTDKVSVTADFIEYNIERRKVSKGEMFDAKMAGNKPLHIFKSNEQTSFKISNNSLSGAQASNSTILKNKTAHSSLTSTCRTATSYGNANNEKFLFGNRHYWSPEIVKGNIVSVLNSTDYEALEKALTTHNLRHPTIEETCESIQYSTDLYWNNQEELGKIFDFVAKLDPIERSAFIYTGDFYHLAKFNDGVARDFLTKLSQKSTTPIADADEYINAMDDDMKAFVCSLCAKELAGRTLKDIKVSKPNDYAIVGATAKNVINTLDEYKFLIKGLWCVNTLPASVAHVRSSIRRGVITSDTDSTIFTVQDWVKWYTGSIGFDEQSNAIFYAVVYLATQTIAHMLALVSAGMGVREKYMHTLAMKNEFAYPVFVLTSMAKHYFAYIAAQEGNVYDEYDVEVKGVYLKDSNAPPHVMEAFHNSLTWTMDRIIEGNGLEITTLLKKVAQIEKDVESSVRGGDSFYLTSAQVKDPSSYKNPAVSPYVHYGLWQDVFAPKYGDAPQPPYAAVRISVNLNNKTKINEWLNGMADQELAERMRGWLTKSNKLAVTSLLLPKATIKLSGIPEEVLEAMNIRKLIYNTVKPFYFLLESLGVYMINDKLTKLVSDTVEP